MPITDEEASSSEVAATRDGRVTIPAQLRRAAGIEPGSRLVLYVDHGRVVIEERAHLLTRIQQEAIDAAAAAGASSGSAVDQLLDERRAEAAREIDEPPTGSADSVEDGGAQ